MRIYLIACGGAIMHNLAIALKKAGHEVTGSDDEIYDPAKSRLLLHNLLPREFGWHPEFISPEIDLVVLGMHAKIDNPELKQAQELGLEIVSFPQLIAQLSTSKIRVAICGSHGKTTVTAMIMHVLNQKNINFDYVCGSRVEGFEDSVKLSDAPIIIIEGDEYLSSALDRKPKFLWYYPQILVINGVEWDHINVFPTYQEYLHQFELLLDNCTSDTFTIANEDIRVVDFIESYDFLGTQAVAHSPKINKVGVKTIIDFQGEEYPISIFGNHNISNLAVAREVCIKLGISTSEFYQAIADFKGAAKRLELLYQNDQIKVFLDFAHAPSKVAASVKAVQDWFKGSRISIFLELNTFSSLNPEFIVQYSNTIEEVENLFVFIHPDVQKQKVNYDLDEDFLRNAFNNPQLNFIQDSNILASKMTEIKANSDVILIMSSGNLGGIELGRIFVD